ncbi:tetratricopeptide repeat protein [Polluticaenibacter yanchengensis]|uniref:Thioredoxin domain-containing protein n=1 Tax=Polluticaenibacter yanchengensis TaxID=3014562 RepID=A0ABT4UMQ0_9BACT|nr:hypothetical protein [Chitinophagaceae bacterium LY-5]
MNKIFIALLLCLNMTAFSQSKERILYGIVTTDTLTKAPFESWFNTGYNQYSTNTEIQKQLSLLYKDVKIEAYFGNWCGDSKRELPHFIKVLNDSKFDKKHLKLIAVGGRDSLYKQSPGGEEAGKGIFRVPVFIVYKNNIEIGRINEFPVQSSERDLLSILQSNYSPNYKSFATVNQWLNNGILADSNANVRGLSGQVKALVNDEHELNSLAYLLLGQNKNKEALTLFRINANLYPTSANVISSLGEAYLKTGEKEKAIGILEKSLEFYPNASLIKEILGLLYKAKGAVE